MRVFSAAWAALLCVAGPVFAAGYDSLSSGLTALLHDDSAAAIAAFTAALESKDLVPAYRPVALRGRASANLRLGRCDEAMADIEAYPAANAQEKDILQLRLRAHLCKREAEKAREIFLKLSGGKPCKWDYWGLVKAEWWFGYFDAVADDAKRALADFKKNDDAVPYILLWQSLSAARAGHFDPAALAADIDRLTSDRWPKPILDYYLGKRSLENLDAEAKSLSESRELRQRCETNFYVAEFLLARNGKEAAIQRLLAANESCPLDFLEYSSARTELTRLGVPLPKD